MRPIRRAVVAAQMSPDPGVLRRVLVPGAPGYTGAVTADPATATSVTPPVVIPAVLVIPREGHRRANLIAALLLSVATVAVIVIVLVAVTLR